MPRPTCGGGGHLPYASDVFVFFSNRSVLVGCDGTEPEDRKKRKQKGISVISRVNQWET
jgi:hypothetical protein